MTMKEGSYLYERNPVKNIQGSVKNLVVTNYSEMTNVCKTDDKCQRQTGRR